jgi:hypothetical protein
MHNLVAGQAQRLDLLRSRVGATDRRHPRVRRLLNPGGVLWQGSNSAGSCPGEVWISCS